MAHMIPEYEQGCIMVRTDRDENWCLPMYLVGSHPTLDDCRDYIDGTPVFIEVLPEAWVCRLSAPGYLDCTDWMGPFDTEEAAREAIAEAYDVDPDSGDDFDDADDDDE